ncbi:ricin-type beta-trefoil lectin domain protein [Catenulispora rubra]|uniref:ricin-type beta-trefoil lectin domain protein n=1 Tax=Catenulispora rubra TaxID=280293 RepID=UPI00189211EC|nr:ricin-type beta-trefoil lectin domain protein [Catenulispora rubra]
MSHRHRVGARWRRRLVGLIAALAIPVGYLTFVAAVPAQAAASAHYVDCSQGTNGNGTQASPWNNVASVNAVTYGAGDQILFARGTTCSGALHPAGSGSAAAAISIDAYGTGALPVINDGSADNAVVELNDQSFWDISNLEIVGGVHFGVYITGNTATASLHHFHLTNLNVHGATFDQKNRGLDGEVYIYPNVAGETISDVVIDSVTAHDSKVSEGIFLGGYWGAFPVGSPVPPSNATFGSGFTIENSSAYNVNGDGILLTAMNNALVTHSVVHDSGQCWLNNATGCSNSTPSGLWQWFCHSCTEEYDESYANHSTGLDGGSFEFDDGNQNDTVQYSYGHDSDGYCIGTIDSNYDVNNTFRYNVCANNQQHSGGTMPDVLVSAGAASAPTTTNIYSNTFYHSPGDGHPWLAQGAHPAPSHAVIKNNIVYSTLPEMVNATSTATLDNNLFYVSGGRTPTFTYDGTAYTGLAAYQAGSGQDSHSLAADPKLNLAGNDSVGMPTLAYSLTPGSPAFGAGTNACAGITGCDMGSHDFYGNPVTTTGTHNIGAYDAPTGLEVIQNAGFESGDCTGWNCYRGTTVVAGNAHSGSYAVQTPPNAGAEQTITGLTPKTTYTLTGWAKSGTAGQCEYIGVKNFGGAEARGCANTTAYTDQTVVFTTGATNTSATIYAWNASGNSTPGYGDDLALSVGAPSTVGELVLSASSTCLDVPGGSTTNGTQVEIWTCGGGGNQTWTHTYSNAIQVYSGASLKCLDDLGGAKTSGSPVGIWSCTGGTNQQWVLHADGTITTPAASGLCLGVPNGQAANGTLITLQTCNGGAYQKWAMQ